VPIGALLASFGLLGVASARPQLVQNVPIGRTSIILALDVSQSMCATDVSPNRISAAQQAARDFVQNLPAGTRIGLVVFSGFAQLAVPPTTDRKSLTSAIDALTTARGTAIGAAMLKSLDAISEVNSDVKPVGDAAVSGAAAGEAGAVPPGAPATAAPGTGGFVPDIVVLLTDGANTRGIAPLDAVPYAVDRRVRIYTIAFGTAQPAGLSCSAQQLGGSSERFGGGGFGGGGFGGGGFGGGGGFAGGGSPLRADSATLKKVADETGGMAYSAQDAQQLRKVFGNLPKDVTVQKKRHEITATFLAFGAVLAAAAIGASIRWGAYP
jgi:Ca-activated chloride channel family protein